MRRHLRRREREGLTYPELEELTGVSRHTLSWWAWKLRREEDPGPGPGGAAFLEVDVLPEEAPAEAGVEITLANGRRLALQAGFDEETLRRAVAVLERPC